MHVKGKKLTAGEKENILTLYRQGKTQNMIVTLTGVSKGRVSKTIKLRGISRPQGRGKVTPIRPVTVKKVTVNPPVLHKVDRPLRPINLTVTDEKRLPELKVNGQGHGQVKSQGQVALGQERSKSRSRSKSSFGIGWKFIGYGFLGLCLWLATLWVIDFLTGSQRLNALLSWVFPNMNFETQESPEPKIKKTFGYGGRSVEDLEDSTGYDLPGEDIPDEI